MLGGELVRGIVPSPWQRLQSRAGQGRSWHPKGFSERGEMVWERLFSPRTGRRGFLVTVFFDRSAGRARSLFATDIARGERAPKVPQYVKRQTQSFIAELQSAYR